MSPTWLLLVLVSLVTGNPLAALGLLLAVLWVADRVTLGAIPDPGRAFARWRRAGRLRTTLAANPSDRRARLELADLLLARRPAEAAELLRRNVEEGDEDVLTAFLLGAALARSGAHDGAERAFAVARDLDPAFRMGETELELGRLRLARGDAAGAREALERLVAARPGTVEGRWLLSRALAGLGDGAGAERVRDEAWREFRGQPRFRRRFDRRFAWRMRPLRGAAVMAGVVAAIAAGALAVAAAAVAWTSAPPAGLAGGDLRRGELELTAGPQRVTIGYFHRDGRVTHLLAWAWPRTTPLTDADSRQKARAIGGRRATGGAEAVLDDGNRLTVFPIEMAAADVESLRGRSLGRFEELVEYLRRFEVKAAEGARQP